MTARTRPQLVIVRPDRLGDVVISSSVLPLLIQRYAKDFEIIWSVKEEYVGLFIRITNISVIPCEKLAEFLSAKSSQENPRKVIFLNPAAALEKEIQSVESCKGTEFFGWGRTLLDERKACKIPESQECARLLAAAGFPIDEPGFPLVCPDEIAVLLPTASPYVVLHVGSFKNKPTLLPRTFAELTLSFRKMNLEVIWLGLDVHSRDFRELSDLGEKLKVIFPPQNLNVIGLAAWLKNAKGVVGRDSGVAHLAAALGVPTVAVVGPLAKTLAIRRWSVVGLRARSLEYEVAPRWWESDRAYQMRAFAAAEPEEILEIMKLLFNCQQP